MNEGKMGCVPEGKQERKKKNGGFEGSQKNNKNEKKKKEFVRELRVSLLV